MNMDYTADRAKLTNEKAPLFRNIHLKNITADGAPVAIRLTGLDDSLIQDITFEDVAITATAGVLATNVQGLRFDRVKITPAKGPAFVLSNARDILIRGGQVPAGATTFLSLEGVDSKSVVIEGLDLSKLPTAVTTGPGVAAGAVQVR